MVTKLVALEKSTSQMFLGRNWLAYSMAFKLIICLIAIVIGVVSGTLPTLNVGVFRPPNQCRKDQAVSVGYHVTLRSH